MTWRVTVEDGGRLTIPVEICRDLGSEAGDPGVRNADPARGILVTEMAAHENLGA